MKTGSEHEQWMALSLELARRGEGRTRPNPPVGAVVIRSGRVVGRGFHPRAGEPHAEVFALRDAGEAARGGELYVTLEPCSHQGRTGPCTEAVLAAGVTKVFIGCTDPNPRVAGRGIERLRQAGLTVECGLLESECRRLIAPFAKHITTGLPFVILKTAMTLDGKTATATGDSKWITSEASRAHVHQCRNRCDAVLTGIGTVLADNPLLTVRGIDKGRNPVRVIVDSALRLPLDARILDDLPNAALIIATTDKASRDKMEILRERGAEVITMPQIVGQVNLASLFADLGRRGLQSVLLESGAELNGEMLRRGFVDRMMVFIAPRIVGGADARGVFGGCGVARMAQSLNLRDLRTARFGDDILIEGEVEACSPD